jgi:hypothetical protein
MLLPGSLGEMERREALQDGKWLRLLPDLREVQWRFYDEAQQDYVDEWPEGARPPLIELNLTLLGEEVPRKFVFWLPPVKEVDLVAEQQPAEPQEPQPPQEPVTP